MEEEDDKGQWARKAVKCDGNQDDDENEITNNNNKGGDYIAEKGEGLKGKERGSPHFSISFVFALWALVIVKVPKIVTVKKTPTPTPLLVPSTVQMHQHADVIF